MNQEKKVVTAKNKVFRQSKGRRIRIKIVKKKKKKKNRRRRRKRGKIREKRRGG